MKLHVFRRQSLRKRESFSRGTCASSQSWFDDAWSRTVRSHQFVPCGRSSASSPCVPSGSAPQREIDVAFRYHVAAWMMPWPMPSLRFVQRPCMNTFAIIVSWIDFGEPPSLTSARPSLVIHAVFAKRIASSMLPWPCQMAGLHLSNSSRSRAVNRKPFHA